MRRIAQMMLARDGGRYRRTLRPASCITTTPSANTPMTGNPRSESSTRDWTRPRRKGWPLISMKNDWKTIFPAAK